MAVSLFIFVMIPMPDVLQKAFKDLLGIAHLLIFLIVLRYDEYTFLTRFD
jgi:hypothetical protein